MGTWMQSIPLWGMYPLTVGFVLASIFVGFRLGNRRRSRLRARGDEPVGTSVGATLGLLAFMLAFTFSMASSRFETRKHLLLDEVNAIGTAYLRADMLPEPERSASRSLFREYVDARVEWVGHTDKLLDAITRSEALHARLWSQAVSFAAKAPDSEILNLFADSLNKVIDLHSERVTVGLRYRIPESIWMTLFFLTAISMAAVGYQFGLAGGGGVLFPLFLALGFSTVILLISDLDRVGGSFLKVSQEAMVELQHKVHAAAD